MKKLLLLPVLILLFSSGLVLGKYLPPVDPTPLPETTEPALATDPALRDDFTLPESTEAPLEETQEITEEPLSESSETPEGGMETELIPGSGTPRVLSGATRQPTPAAPSAPAGPAVEGGLPIVLVLLLLGLFMAMRKDKPAAG